MPVRTVEERVSIPLPPLAGALKCTVAGTWGTSKWNNVFHMKSSSPGPFSLTDLNTISAAFLAAYGTHFPSILSTTWTATACEVQDLTNDTGLVVEATGSHGGAITGTLEVGSIAAVISWKISRHYRGGHPRTYMAGTPSTAVADSQHFTSQFAGDLAANAALFRTACNAISAAGAPGLQLGQISYYHGKNTDGSPMLRETPIFDVFNNATADTRIDSQRRRLGKPPLV